MSTAQRVSRGFHRLALFLAAIPLLFGVIFTELYAYQLIRHNVVRHDLLTCVHEHFADLPQKEDASVILIDVACRDLYGRALDSAVGMWGHADQPITYGQARNPPNYPWTTGLAWVLGVLLGPTIAVSLIVYGLVRAIGWVIGGFAA